MTFKEMLEKLKRNLETVTNHIDICKKEKPSTSTQKSKRRHRLKRLRFRRNTIVEKINELEDKIYFSN